MILDVPPAYTDKPSSLLLRILSIRSQVEEEDVESI